MKVICIISNNEFTRGLVVGKWYEVLESCETLYMVWNDNGLDMYYSKYYFNTVEEYRNNQIDKIL